MAFPDHRRLLGVVSGMIVWALWFVFVYALTGLGCAAGWHTHAVAGGNLLSLAMLVGTALALLLIALCARRGYRGWRGGQRARAAGQEAAERARFAGLVMCVLSLLAALSTLMIALPLLMLGPCAS